MGNVIFLLISFVIIFAIVMAMGIGAGFVVNWMLPEVELGMAIVIGTVMAGLAIQFFVRLVRYFNDYRIAELLKDGIEFEEEEQRPRRGTKRR